MEPISLTFFADDEVPLPAKIIESTLTLAQIGALACMQCLQKYAGNMDAVEPRLKSEEMAAAMRELVALRVFKVGKSGDAIQMEVDLSPVFPAAAGGAEPAGDWQPPADGAPDKSPAGTNSDSASVEIPYIITTRAVVEKSYNPRFGDDRMCSCGHPYYRHFDTYEGMEPCGCKYCDCASFLESKGPNESSAPDPIAQNAHEPRTAGGQVPRLCSAWWLRGWTRKRDQYCACRSDPLDLCVVHGRQETAIRRHRWESRIVIEHPCAWKNDQTLPTPAQNSTPH